MSKKREEINPQSGLRLKMTLAEKGISQSKLSEMTYISTNTISKVINGKTAMTENLAVLIGAALGVRPEWLRGTDDFPTKNSKELSEFFAARTSWKQRWTAVQTLAALAGYEIDLPVDEGEAVQNVLEAVQKGYRITKDGEPVGYISLERFNLLCTEIEELTEWRIKSYLRETSPL